MAPSFGYAGRTLRIDLTEKTFAVEPTPPELIRDFLGGRGFNMARLFREVPRGASPLDPENTLFVGVGPLNGTSFPGSSRVNFSARSPQTGRLGDSNAGTALGAEIKYAGYDQIILEGRAERLCYLHITDGGVRFCDGEALRGLDVLETQARIRSELGDPYVRMAAVGPAAESGVVFSGIFCTGVRAAARTGMGLVMASKNVKALAVRGHTPLRVASPGAFEASMDDIRRRVREHRDFAPRRRMGTTFLVTALNGMGCLSTRHYQEGVCADAPRVSGETLADTVKRKSRGCFSCTIPCSRVYEVPGPDGKPVVGEGPEFEGLAGFSTKIGCDDLAFALACCNRCNRLGLDVITASEAVAFPMELFQRGLLSPGETDGLELSWGNKEAVWGLLEKIARREGFGDLLGDGVVRAAEKLGRGQDLVMHVKGLEIFQADPRGIKAYALGVSVASRGGDHLRSEPSFEFSGDGDAGRRLYGTEDAAFRLKWRGKGRVVKDFEERCALSDSLNVCKNTLVNMELVLWDETARILTEATGLPWEGEAVRTACERIVNLERLYLARHGLDRAADTLPKRFLEEPLTSGATAGSVVELDAMLDEYYDARGWDRITGHPTAATRQRLGLTEDRP